MHEARKAVITSESSEKILRALRLNISLYEDAVFAKSNIYYEKNYSKRCTAPGKVTGVESHQILMKHSSFYVRCH